MPKTQDEFINQRKAGFERIRNALWNELIRLLAIDKTFDALDNTYKNEKEIFRLAPGFFTVINISLNFTLVNLLYRIAIDNDERVNSIRTYLAFVRNNSVLFTQKETDQKKLEQLLSEDDEVLKKFEHIFKKITCLRNNFFAHLSKEFSGNLSQLNQRWEIKPDEWKSVVSWIGEVYNRYSGAFDCHYLELEDPDLTDVDRLINLLRSERDRWKENSL